MIDSAMIEHAQKHDEHHDGALLTLSGCSYNLVASAASGLWKETKITDTLSWETHLKTWARGVDRDRAKYDNSATLQ